jgi:hypothetical protein
MEVSKMAELTEQEIQEHEKQVAEVTGQVHDGFDVLAGSDPGDAQARRFARLEFQQADFESNPTDAIENYSGPRTGSEVQNYDQWHSFLSHQESLAGEKYPDYQKVVKTYLEPLLPQVDPEELRKFLLRDDAAEQAYRAAKKLQRQFQSKAPTQEEIEQLDGDQFAERLREWTRSARSQNDDDGQQTFVTKSEMRQMAKLNPEDFARALDFVKSR